jgi:hypothetical protein
MAQEFQTYSDTIWKISINLFRIYLIWLYNDTNETFQMSSDNVYNGYDNDMI